MTHGTFGCHNTCQLFVSILLSALCFSCYLTNSVNDHKSCHSVLSLPDRPVCVHLAFQALFLHSLTPIWIEFCESDNSFGPFPDSDLSKRYLAVTVCVVLSVLLCPVLSLYIMV